MAIIKKKIHPKYFEAVTSGKKTFELRLHDFNVAAGDTLVMEEWDPETKAYTGQTIEKKVTYALPFKIDELFWPETEIEEKGLQIISLEPSIVARPKVGVCVLVFKDGRVLLGRRLGKDGTEGMYGTPGGHLELQETPSECALREIAEEVGIEIENIRFTGVVNVRDFAPAHYVMIVLSADWKAGEPQVMEPDRCSGWDWFAFDALPSPMTPGSTKGIQSYLTGRQLFE